MDQLIKPNSYNNNNINKKQYTKLAQKVSLSILVVSFPLLYASLFHHPLSSLFKDTTFWFLISNSIIIIVAADSGMFSSSSSTTDQIYEEYVKHTRATTTAVTRSFSPPVIQEIKQQQTAVYNIHVEEQEVVPKETEPELAESPKEEEEEEELVVEEEKQIIVPKTEYRRSQTEVVSRDDSETGRERWVPRSKTMVVESRRSCGMEESEYWKMSDEELNKRVEDFIRRFNREIRLEATRSAAVY